ncbi:ABC transporter ATP-binding protein [Aureimonas fodinaquatilis]|uniref:ABC transporter ATP-binding protein n=1 Tax=Aureimonas fodinaquatilis TaxID=2565783 RepID=A0A5B0DY84_9HYPH|nr:ABC transporter ATP-binding protein [Aureimonas fodinaquatilis]KAA0970169.1 ABC transporter ATP-binding protein [Aureimonas fodinaquatilis]
MTTIAKAGSKTDAHDLRLRDLKKDYGTFQAVRGIDLHVPAGNMVSLIGSSGCGKTTTLRMIAGLEIPTSGTIQSGGMVMSDGPRVMPPEKRDMGMVFQTYALWPHMTVAHNVGYGLKQKGFSKDQTARKVQEVLDIVNMGNRGERYPHQLSGGQQQRVALARAIASEPRTLLFDEPLSNLDAVLREQMRFEIRSLQQRLGITAVYVTHSQEEALALSDSIAVMRDGLIEQSGEPSTIYNLPRNEFVASFIGLANILTLENTSRDGESLIGQLHGTAIRAAGGALGNGTGAVKLCVRPVDISISRQSQAKEPGFNELEGVVDSTVFTGGLVDYFVRLNNSPETILRVQSTPPARATTGDAVRLSFDPERTVALED